MFDVYQACRVRAVSVPAVRSQSTRNRAVFSPNGCSTRQPVRHLPGFARPVAPCRAGPGRAGPGRAGPGQPGGQLRWPSGLGLFDYFLPGIPSGCTILVAIQSCVDL